MKQRVKDMEAEAQKLREMQAEVEREQSALSGLTEEEKEAVDARSVHVGNVSPLSFSLLSNVGREGIDAQTVN